MKPATEDLIFSLVIGALVVLGVVGISCIVYESATWPDYRDRHECRRTGRLRDSSYSCGQNCVGTSHEEEWSCRPGDRGELLWRSY